MKHLIEYINESLFRDNRKNQTEDIETLIDTEYYKLSMSEIDNYLNRRIGRLKPNTDDIFKELYDSETPYKEYQDAYDHIDEYTNTDRKKNIFVRMYDRLVNHIRQFTANR